MDDTTLYPPGFASVAQCPNRRPILDLFFFGQAAAVEELPPHGFLLATVKLQQVRQQPPRPLPVVEAVALLRQLRGERLEQRRDLGRRFPLPVALFVPYGRPRHGLPGAGLEFAPAFFQPLGEPQRGEAVVAVVALYLGAEGVRRAVRRARLQRRLETDQRTRCGRQVDPAHEAVERLQPLDRVPLDRGAQPLPDHPVQVDEDAAAQQPVDLFLAGGVAAHQALDRGRLVGAVVVDVEARILPPARRDAVDETLERTLLGGFIERPAAVVSAVPIRGSEEVLEPAARREGIAFEIEEEVARRGCRQRGESLVFLDRRNQLVHAPAFTPSLILDARLLPDPNQRVVADGVRRRKRLQIERPETRHRRHAPVDQLAPLAARDPGDQRQVIVGASAIRTALLPVAERTMVDRLRIGVRRLCRVRLEAPADGAVVRGVRHDPEACFSRPVAAAERQVHSLRRGALHLGQQVRIQQKLEQRLALCDAGQLRVEHLVRPAAQRACFVHPEQEIGIAAPLPVVVLQAPLVDDVDPAPHRFPGVRRRLSRVVLRERRLGWGDDLHGAALCREPFQQTALVLDPALLQDLRAGVVVRRRPLDLPERGGAAQARQVGAGEMAAQVGGGEQESAVGVAHRAGR